MIEIQQTSDENTINFFPPKDFLKGGNVEFVTAKSLRRSPLAEAIFDLGGITQILLTSDMISVTKNEASDWKNLRPLILAEIMDYITSGQPPVVVKEEKNNDEILAEINALIEARIRPAIKKDGGDIVIKSFSDGILYVKLVGNCAGCPYAMVTLKEGVEKILKHYIPEIKSVQHSDD